MVADGAKAYLTSVLRLIDETGAAMEGESEGYAIEDVLNLASGGIAASTIFSPRNAVGVFGGSRGLTKIGMQGEVLEDITGSYQKALTLLKEGKVSPGEVWKQTGWFRDVDGHVKFEFPVSPDRILRDDVLEKMIAKTATAGDMFDKSDPLIQNIFKAYPDLEDMPVQWVEKDDTAFGMYRPPWKGKRDYIEMNPDAIYETYFKRNPNVPTDTLTPRIQRQMKETFIHEMQHAIQNREKWSGGASPESIWSVMWNEFKGQYHSVWAKMTDEGRLDDFKPYAKSIERAQDMLAYLSHKAPEAAEAMKHIDKLKPNEAEVLSKWDDLYSTLAHRLYRLNDGETGARMAQKRLSREDFTNKLTGEEMSPVADMFARGSRGWEKDFFKYRGQGILRADDPDKELEALIKEVISEQHPDKTAANRIWREIQLGKAAFRRKFDEAREAGIEVPFDMDPAPMGKIVRPPKELTPTERWMGKNNLTPDDVS